MASLQNRIQPKRRPSPASHTEAAIPRRKSAVYSAVCFAIAALVGVRFWQWSTNPEVVYLSQDAQAEWIRPQVATDLEAHRTEEMSAMFVLHFTTARPIENAKLHVRALRKFEIALDREFIFSTEHEEYNWKDEIVVPIKRRLLPGNHELTIVVINTGGFPCLWAYSRELGVRSNADWLTTTDLQVFSSVMLANHRELPVVAASYPSLSQSTRSLALWILLMFAGFIGIICLADYASTWMESRVAHWRITAARVRAGLYLAWIVLIINNTIRAPAGQGFDAQRHFEYIEYLVHQHALPLATDGWQMFQSPLFYLLAAPIYALQAEWLDEFVKVKMILVMQLLFGMIQIEIVFRAARLAFPTDEHLQNVALIVGGMFPANIYMSHWLGNEPLAAMITGWLIVACWALMRFEGQQRSWLSSLTIGSLWGLALLAKVTPVLLGPMIVSTINYQVHRSGRSWSIACRNVAVTLLVALIVSGWYFARNWLYLGKPFVGGWEQARGMDWWQYPGYRTWEQLTSFGAALDRPVWSATFGFWDSLYSTMWLDGMSSGSIESAESLCWNVNWMVACAGLGLLPTVLILIGVLTSWHKKMQSARPMLLWSTAAIAIYVAAIFELYLQVPIYSTAKASYMLGLLPCFAILAAAGSKPLMDNRWIRSITYALLLTWATTVYTAYFVCG
ncbi:MAG: hypothetical protein KF752_16195 [Pirellulaceae bacterium]|nr:hypothetical protein [Pirellulaceae bacterium]